MDEAWYVRFAYANYQWLKQVIESRLPPAHKPQALDFCQEVFTEAWIHRDKIPPNPRPWLFAKAQEKLRGFKRSSRREVALTFAVTNEMRERLPDFLRGADLNVDFSRAFKMLRKTEAETLWMHLLGLTALEIAQHYGLKEDAARQRVKRALDRLRHHFDPADSQRRVPDSSRSTDVKHAR